MPVHVLAGRDTAPLVREGAAWLAERRGTSVQELPGAHTAMFTHPEQLAATLRPLL